MRDFVLVVLQFIFETSTMRGRWCQKATDSVYRSQVDNNPNESRILAKGTLKIGTKNDRLID